MLLCRPCKIVAFAGDTTPRDCCVCRGWRPRHPAPYHAGRPFCMKLNPCSFWFHARDNTLLDCLLSPRGWNALLINKAKKIPPPPARRQRKGFRGRVPWRGSEGLKPFSSSGGIKNGVGRFPYRAHRRVHPNMENSEIVVLQRFLSL